MTAPLSALNKSSAKLAAFHVRIVHPHKQTYQYISRRNGKQVEAHKFEAYLVGETPEQYCMAKVGGTEQHINAAAERFSDGSLWILSKVVFDTAQQAAYIGSPLQFCIDLSKSTLEPITGAPDWPSSVLPTRTVAVHQVVSHHGSDCSGEIHEHYS